MLAHSRLRSKCGYISRRFLKSAVLALALGILGAWMPASQALPPEIEDAIAWYDTLGYPNAKDLPYVRVATGLYSITGNQPPKNNFVKGFLVAKEDGAFTVFLCSVPNPEDRYPYEPYHQFDTIRFVEKRDVPIHKRVEYEVLDFQKAASETLAQITAAAQRDPYRLQWGVPLSIRARLFAFARACQQKGEPEVASVLFEQAANIPDLQSGKPERQRLRATLQDDIGRAVLQKAEDDCASPATSWQELLKAYEDFGKRFPGCSRIAYAEESADLLRKMTAEEAAHHPKPLDQMSREEQVAENIYQLRNLGSCMWIMNQHYPLMAFTREGKEMITPVHRLTDLGMAAVPQLIAALDDRRFTHCAMEDFHGRPEVMMRVGEVARYLLQHLAGGRNFYPDTRNLNLQERQEEELKEHALMEAGLPVLEPRPFIIVHTSREKAEAWWREVQGAGEKQTLIKAASEGGDAGVSAARKLVEKYPDAALDAIQAGAKASKEDGIRGEYVEVAATLPKETPVAFLKSQLTPDHGIYARVHAAKALFDRGQRDMIPGLIETWRKFQPPLLTNDGDAYGQVGGLIGFLAASGDDQAIDALWEEGRKAPVEVRRAIIEFYLPFGMSGGGVGESVNDWLSTPDHEIHGGEKAIERLLVAALDDRERRLGLEMTNSKVSLHDPRICDLAAVALSGRWPEKYPFEWTANVSECDTRIATLRNQWRVENKLPPLAPAAPLAIPAASESQVAPLLDEFAKAGQPQRDALTAKIAETFGLGALPIVRARWEKSKDDVLRMLAIDLASRVREVRIATDTVDGAKTSNIASLKGQALTAARLYQLAYDLQNTLPAHARAVTVVAERIGDGTGFQVTVEWLPGKPAHYEGWKREMAVRSGDKNLLSDIGGWAMEGVMDRASIYRRLRDAFGEALQSDIDAPITMRLRIQRSNADVP